MVDEIRHALRLAGERLAAAYAERAAALDEIASAMKGGHGAISIKEMSELAGVSRVTAYRLIEA